MKKLVISIVYVFIFTSFCYGFNTVKNSTGLAAMDESDTRSESGQGLLEVRLHLQSAGTTSEYFTVTIDSADGSQYDTLLYRCDMLGVQDIAYQPTHAQTLKNNGDTFDFQFTNTDSSEWGLERVYKEKE